MLPPMLCIGSDIFPRQKKSIQPIKEWKGTVTRIIQIYISVRR